MTGIVGAAAELAPRLVGRWGPDDADTTLVVLASVHGNEPAGYRALQRVREAIAANPPELDGRLVGLVGNRVALARGCRFVDSDLNRLWTTDMATRIGREPPGATDPVEYGEASELLAAIEEAKSPGTTYVLDLHTTSGHAAPFAVLADTLRNRRFARRLSLPVVLGLEEQLDGTLLTHLERFGYVTTGCEGGRHEAAESVDHLEAVIWLALESAGILSHPGSVPQLARARRGLREAAAGLPSVLEVRHRHAVIPEDEFVMEPGFRSFQAIATGEVLGRDRRGVVTAPEHGRLLMPLYQAQGSDGFFLVRPIRPFWLALSALLRRIRLGSIMHWLPGVTRDPSRPGALFIDRRRARWYAMEVFHLLGFRRERVEGDVLVVTRRPDPI